MEESVEIYHTWQKAANAKEEAQQIIKAESDPEMKNFLQAERISR